VTAVDVFVEVEGELIQQSLSADVLADIFASVTLSSSGQDLVVTGPTESNFFVAYERSFYFNLNIAILEVDITIMEGALSQAWMTSLGMFVLLCVFVALLKWNILVYCTVVMPFRQLI